MCSRERTKSSDDSVSGQLSVFIKNAEGKMMSGKIFLWLLATLSLTTVPHAHAQQPKKVFHIGFLSSGASSASENIEVIRQRLRELGYVEGKNIAFEYRGGGRKN
jgi:hypothetical protein